MSLIIFKSHSTHVAEILHLFSLHSEVQQLKIIPTLLLSFISSRLFCDCSVIPS